jgi:hypothetical protein
VGLKKLKVSMNKRYGWVILAAMAVAIAGCGGGGGGSVAPTFPLRAALDKLTRDGGHFNLVAKGTGAVAADGDCTGSLNESDAAAVGPVTFEGNTNAKSSAITAIMQLSNCTPANLTTTEIDYFDANYLPLGAVVSGIDYYGIYATAPPISIPTTVKVGDSGVIGTINFQASSTDTTSKGHADRTYVIESDSATTAIANSISNVYDAGGTTPVSKSEVRYRIDTQGNLSIVSQDIIKYGATTVHLVFRCDPAGCS